MLFLLFLTAVTVIDVSNSLMRGYVTPKNCNCGLAVRSKRIIDGGETEISEYPWQVGLVSGSLGKKVWCSGALISDEWILTAARCVQFKELQNIQVLLGEHDYSDTSETEEVRASLKKMVTHPQYAFNDYDFALLQLKNPIDFSKHKHIRPICLPSNATEMYTDTEAIVSFWGEKFRTGKPNFKLQAFTAKVISQAECESIYIGVFSPKITNQKMCAKTERKVPCKTIDFGALEIDNGAPLVSANGGDGVTPGQNYESIGVMQNGNTCSRHYPDVYQRTTAGLDWIIEETEGSFNTCPRVCTRD